MTEIATTKEAFNEAMEDGWLSCSNCLFFDTYAEGLPIGKTPRFGFCRKNPPVIVEPDKIGRWPVVTSLDWCGGWVENPDEEIVGDNQ